MFNVPSELLCIVEIGVGAKHTFEVEGGSVWKVLEFCRNGEAFVFQQLENGGWRLVCTAREGVMYLCFTGSFVTMQHTHMLPKLSTSQASVGFRICLHIFNVRKVVLMEVEVKSTWIVTTVNQLSGDFWLGVSVFLDFILYISFLGL